MTERKERRNIYMGKMANNDTILANMDTLVRLDKQYQSLLASRDRAGLIELAEVARAHKQTCVARKASQAAAEI